MCERLTLPDGTVAIVCGGHGRRRKRCVGWSDPGKACQKWAEYECETCDAPLCRRCRIHVPPDRDYCKAHLAQASAAAAKLRARRKDLEAL